MSTELATIEATEQAQGTTPATAVTLAQTAWTPEQRTVLENAGCAARNEADWNLFLFVCQRTGLDPFARQIYMVNYGGKPTIQTGIDGYRVIADRVIAERDVDFEPARIEWCGPDGVWVDVWLAGEPPAAARATVVRDGKSISSTALYREYVGRTKEGKVNSMWRTMPANQLGKCAEAGVLRKAFPQDMAGVYIAEEMSGQPKTTVSQVAVAPEQPKTAGYFMKALRLTGVQFKGLAERVLGRDPGSWEGLPEADQQAVLDVLAVWELSGADPTQADVIESDAVEVDHETGEIPLVAEGGEQA